MLRYAQHDRLLIAYCLRPTAYWLHPTVYCFLGTHTKSFHSVLGALQLLQSN
jgi:hypothetical protein